ncbi:4-diphosphocytidyl-2C-methyl-D-erythritol kinase [Gluconacetobacter diazotrophicus PA1 5]|uniref:4-diphosphocytidyl-2-C-methyl-D-erythritol kinase n=1 Tax=Gluconacetobacter diazotrophicus TaxID=33996 RepID=A0A7W4NHC1_GLUDI|nr:4-(cytidine 5'-diphospho)-2-C-methyl-D-erythritol kinase [Gluconacetobacter diazotrophicus]ACI51065.1 4-diphosphocytidyl-2C-methyl-D-erythritol kinase [Gluconacetobacter diazotrophicus PA1 5]MBB2157766.1 4-(cytidine 5'-diphospho)-2-C-methyl-D-erythritol kinase [Gluconacetobacter diazotrophicus]TWB00954.1 4-diphosphocytidyl-2-C-methyl-D-erythritol kinase [Gluconacetobacter diazotrophicus]
MTDPTGTGTLHESAHAKINLYLHVTGRRPDGYHLLDSLAVFAGAADRLTLHPGAAGQGEAVVLDIAGAFGAGLVADTDSNLVLQAARRLRAEMGVTDRLAPMRIVLEKSLPVASGIGGGSADAAAALRLLLRAWPGEAPPRARLMALAVELGADVPVCIDQRPARMGGVGERLAPAPALPNCGMMLVNCGEAVPTPAVFRARAPVFTPAASLPSAWPDVGAMVRDLAVLTNDLQDAACELCPTIRTVLQVLDAAPGCRLARMSGSGATCFALFDSPQAARDAMTAVERPGWWVWAGGLHGMPAET